MKTLKYLALSLSLLLPISGIYADPTAEGLQEPYKPRPTGEPPKGWKIILLENSKVENQIEISPGKEITVGVPAYKLEPSKKDGEDVLILQDPHYNPMLKNAQEDTLGASITKFSEEGEALREKLKEAITTLENSLKKTPEEGETPEVKTSQTKTSQKKP